MFPTQNGKRHHNMSRGIQNGAETSCRRSPAGQMPIDLPVFFHFGVILVLSIFPFQWVGLAQSHNLGGSVRGYQFFGLEDSELLPRRDSELWLLRLTEEVSFGRDVSFEFHGILNFASPPLAGESSLAVSPSRKFLPLDVTFYENDKVSFTGALDRANVQIDLGHIQVKLGRQALTWGVSYFWPAMDIFAPFQPNQVDRDYKAGVDALRITFALNNFSELEILGGILGSSAKNDGAAGALLRWNAGSSDLGFMAGRFHGDTSAGVFITSNVRGTGIRGELTYTDSGDPADEARDREEFWRGSIGLTRQLFPSLGMVAEVAWNGYGSCDPRDYLDRAVSDRVLRGEVTSLGMIHSGVSLSWMFHPLLTLNNSFLVNWNDSSTLWIPVLVWSAGDNSEVLVGGQISSGGGISSNSEGTPALESEYGAIPSSVFGTIRIYF